MQKTTSVLGATALTNYGNDWTGDDSGEISAPDTTNNDEYTCTEKTAFQDCDVYFTLENYTVQCAQLTVNFSRLF